jgi:signal transduction histidine kinase
MMRAYGGAALLALHLWVTVPLASMAEPSQPFRFLLVYGQDSALVANIHVAAGIAAVLSREVPNREVFTEHLDSARFPDPAHADRLAEAMVAKYRGKPMDAVLAVGPGALDFLLKHRADFAPGAPMIFGLVGPDTAQALDLSPDMRGVVSRFDARGTVDLARQLQPDADRVVVVTGSSPFDRSWQETARAALHYRDGIEVDFVSGLSVAGFAEMAAGLDAETILLILTIYKDGAGQTFIPRDAASIIAKASAAPAYGVYSSFVGAGVVGGSVEAFQSIGEEMAKIAVEMTAGVAGPALVDTVPQPLVDWRQIHRFGIDPDRLPPGTQRLFYEPTAWERYRGHILLAFGIIGLQSTTIIALLVQERRRRRMSEELATGRLELAHLSRTAQLGALSGALAHELNQPLTSILANAQAGARFLRQDPPNLTELSAILGDIADDDRRAAEIIVQLRRLMVKGDAALEPVDLNQVVAATVTLARSEMVARQTRVEARPAQGELIVVGNFAQLQQILLNLMLNAAEAMAKLPPAQREMEIATRRCDVGARELAVADCGPGLSPEMRADAFAPFISSKPSGLGFGLAICRAIARAHRGTLAFDDRVAAGTRIVLTLPPP